MILHQLGRRNKLNICLMLSMRLNRQCFALLLLYLIPKSSTSLDEEAIEKKIVNGRKAAEKKYPYSVSITNINGAHMCGGSIITSCHVATACHCVRLNDSGEIIDVFPEFLYVRAGIVNLGVNSKNEQERLIKTIHTHPKCAFENNIVVYDVALLRVTPNFNFNLFVKPIKVPFSIDKTSVKYVNLTYLAENRFYCLTAGWGRTGKEAFSEDLMEVAVPLLPFEECSINMYQASKGRFLLNDSSSQLCTDMVEGKDACSGDSGGGLKCGKYLLGIVSWGLGCGKVGFPSVFSNIMGTEAFIQEVAREANQCRKNQRSLILVLILTMLELEFQAINS